METQVIQKRLKIFMSTIIILFFVLVGRLFFLQIIRGRAFQQRSVSNSIRVTFIPGSRGEIRDRNGVLLAYDAPCLSVCAAVDEIKNIDAFSLKIAPLIGCDIGFVLSLSTLAICCSEIILVLVVVGRDVS